MIQHFSPAGPVRHMIKGYWFLQQAAPAVPGQPQFLFPSGAAEIVIHLGAPLTRILGGGMRKAELPGFIEGQQSGALRVYREAALECFGITLYPWAVYPLFRISPAELTDAQYPLSDIHPALSELHERIRSCRTPAEMSACCDRFFSRAAQQEPGFKTTDRQLISLLRYQEPGTLADLKTHWPYSSRLLEKKFLGLTGLSAGQYYRKKKMARALHLASRLRGASWTRLACEAGYYDQAHLIRHFREYFSTTPRRFSDGHFGLIKAFY